MSVQRMTTRSMTANAAAAINAAPIAPPVAPPLAAPLCAPCAPSAPKINNINNINNCQVKGHTTQGHSCLFCDERINKHLKYCPLNESTPSDEKHKIFDEITIKELDNEITNELLQINHVVSKLKNGTYTHISGGMGSTWFVRRNSNGKKQYLIMLTDDWGQYGKEFSRMPALKSFIHGYEKMIVL